MPIETPTRESVIAALQSDNPDVLQRALADMSELCSDDRKIVFYEIARRMDNHRFFIAFSRALILFYAWRELV